MKKQFTILFIITAFALPIRAQLITTFAGTGNIGYSGDGYAATAARLNNPSAITIDGSGNLYIADRDNHRVRKVSASGIITTIAGIATSGYSGDGSVSTSAELLFPSGVAVDASGNLYIADRDNHRIRKVNTSGIITTVAGNGLGGYSGDGGQATAASLYAPSDVAVDASGNLFIPDYYNQVIRKVSASGIITTVAGNGISGYNGDGGNATAAKINYPSGVKIDMAGNLFIADAVNNRIRKVTVSGIITTVAGIGTAGFSGDGGAATAAELYRPSGINVDNTGNIYIADCGNERVRKVSASGIITTVAGDGIPGYGGDGSSATTAKLNTPLSVAIDGQGNLYIADMGNQRTRKINLDSALAVSRVTNASDNLLLAPNPNSGVFTIKGSISSVSQFRDEKVFLEVINMLGQTVYNSTAPLHCGNINSEIIMNSNVPVGMYLLNIISKPGTNTFRFVIEK